MSNKENPYRQAREGKVPYNYQPQNEEGTFDKEPDVYSDVSSERHTQGESPSDEEKVLGLVVHLISFAGAPFLGPLIIWLIKKDESDFIDLHCRTAMNFAITSFICIFASWVSIFFLIGFIVFPLVIAVYGITGLVCSILGALAAKDGKEYRYPLCIPFF